MTLTAGYGLPLEGLCVVWGHRFASAWVGGRLGRGGGGCSPLGLSSMSWSTYKVFPLLSRPYLSPQGCTMQDMAVKHSEGRWDFRR